MKQILVVVLDLKGPAGHYAPLYAFLQTFPWAHYTNPMWFIETPKTPQEITNELRKFILPDDNFFITKLQQPYQGILPVAAWDWTNIRLHGKTFR